MLTRRGFIIAGGSAFAAAATLGSSAAAATLGAKQGVTVYSHARAPMTAQAGQTQIVLTQDFTATLATFEGLLASRSAQGLRLELDAADSVLFEIAQTRSAMPHPAHAALAV